MRLNHVRIKNFRGIEEKEFDFDKGFNLIKGENGRGKTSILEALAVGLGGFVAGVPQVDTRHFSVGEIRKEYRKTGEASCECINHVPVEVEIFAEHEEKLYHWLRARTSVSSSRSTIQEREIVRLAERLSSDKNAELPVLIYEAASRVWAQKRQKNENPFGKKIIRNIGYMDALLEASNVKLLRDWCIKMELNSFKQKKSIVEYEAAKKAVADFMKLMDQNGSKYEYSVYYDEQVEEIMYQQGDEIHPVMDLSAGYQSLIWMVFDIAFRMALLNPQMGKDITKAGGVILIDEIDMHLHPKWQWNIIKALTGVFPNIQFIATTHAPILFASAKNVEVIDIDKEDIENMKSHYGIDINEAVREFQQTDELPHEVKVLVDVIYDQLDENKQEEAKKSLEELKEELDNGHPLYTKMATLVDLELMNWEN